MNDDTLGTTRGARLSSRQFLDAALTGTFLLRKCVTCDRANPPQAVLCEQCGERALTQTPADGRARVVSWSTVPVPTDAGDVRDKILVIGELTEGPWWWATLEGAQLSDVSLGADLVLNFSAEPEAHGVPFFRLAGPASA